MVVDFVSQIYVLVCAKRTFLVVTIAVIYTVDRYVHLVVDSRHESSFVKHDHNKHVFVLVVYDK
jgi:hypothetical protein